MFGHGWERAEATIVKAATVPIHKGDVRRQFEYVLEVRPAGEEPLRVKLAQPETGPRFGFPKEGHAVTVRFHPKSRKVKWDHSDARSFELGKVDEQQAELDAALRASVDSPPSKAP
jgi:hypothetical protein